MLTVLQSIQIDRSSTISEFVRDAGVLTEMPEFCQRCQSSARDARILLEIIKF